MAVVNFPISPVDGDTFVSEGKNFTWDNTNSIWVRTPAAGAIAPSIYQVYANAVDLPTSSVVTGKMAFVSSTNKLYIWSGIAWFNIALVNAAPTITGSSATYALTRDGTPTVITLSATDPEGLPITWAYAVTTGSLGTTATVAQADNVYTITPSTLAADAGEFSITFTSSDGANVATAVSSFSLSFTSWAWHFGTASTGSTNFHCETTNSLEVDLSQEFTVEAFVNYASPLSGSYQFALTSTTGSGNYNNDFFIGTVPGGQWRWGAAQVAFEGVGTPVVNTWYHVAISKTATHTYFYVNGVLNYTYTGAWGTNRACGVSFGHYYPLQAGVGPLGTSYPFNGYISQCRMLVGTALYNGSNFTPPSTHPVIPGTVVALAYTNTLEDISINPKVMLSSNGPLVVSSVLY
jgi:hypothetical protein